MSNKQVVLEIDALKKRCDIVCIKVLSFLHCRVIPVVYKTILNYMSIQYIQTRVLLFIASITINLLFTNRCYNFEMFYTSCTCVTGESGHLKQLKLFYNSEI